MLLENGIGGLFGGIMLWLYLRSRSTIKEYVERIIKLTSENYRQTKALEDLAETIRISTEKKDPTLTKILKNTDKLCLESDVEREVRHRIQSVPYLPAHKDEGADEG